MSATHASVYEVPALKQRRGLGLSISYKIIEKHRGSIEVISEPGNAAEFVVRLPLNNG